jgi:hypothetical protein
MRDWYSRKSPEERRDVVARRDPAAVRSSEQRRYLKRRGTPAQVANYTMNNAIRDGHLNRGPCEVCGSREGVEGHHEDYSKPLDVRWLCREHHKALHAFKRVGLVGGTTQ